jgi:hypothetical protein
MLTLFVIFVSICLVGAAFWFFNRKQINNLVENIDDKQAIINALQSHVETVQPTPTQKTQRQNKNVDKKKRYNKNEKTNSSEKKNYKPRRPKTQK